MNGGATIKSHAAVLPEIDQSLRSAVANGMRTANVADLSDDLLRDMCDFGKSLPFGRTYVIVMPTGVESVMEKARRLCLNDVQLVPAFHKPATLDELPEAERALFSEDALQSLTTGEIAIHISHRKAVEQCRSDNVSSCLIFEEDFVSAGRELAGRWKSSYENMPSSTRSVVRGYPLPSSTRARVASPHSRYTVPEPPRRSVEPPSSPPYTSMGGTPAKP